MSEKIKKYIDIEENLKRDKPKLYKRLPKFVLFLIKRILHENEANIICRKYKDYSGIDFIPKLIEYFNIKIDVKGIENLPEHKNCIFVANHHLGFLDGLVLTYLVSQKYGKLKAIGNEAFMYIPNMRPMIASVNVFGKNSREYIKDLNELYASDIPITHFPNGTVARVHKGKVKDEKWTKSFITRAVTNERDIVPIRFFEKNSRLFYTIYRIRKFLGIKTNIELILLLNELFRRRNSTVKVKIGKTISYKKFGKTKSHSQWAEAVKEHVYLFEHNNTNINFK